MMRIVLVNCSGVLGDILRDAVRAEPDMTVVSQLEDLSQLAATIREVCPDIVLWKDADEGHLSDSVDYFGATSLTKVLATIGDGRDAALWELRPHRTQLGQLSPTTLVSTIRGAAAR